MRYNLEGHDNREEGYHRKTLRLKDCLDKIGGSMTELFQGKPHRRGDEPAGQIVSLN
jgi:hypothetical protein